MTTDDELGAEFSRGLHTLVADPPPGRNLVPVIRRAAARRRGRVLAFATGLSVTGLVAAGAVAPTLMAPGPASGAGVTATPLGGSPVPSAGAVSAAAAALRTTEFYYQRSIDEQYGIRSERQVWIGRTLPGRLMQPDSAHSQGTSIPLGVGSFSNTYGEKIPWDAFSAVPDAADLHRWMWGTAAESKAKGGHDLTGTARGADYAFGEGGELLTETPTTAQFRLAVLAAMKHLPGVEVADVATDEVGRPGIQLSLAANGDTGSTTLDIIDPKDGRLLQSTIADPAVCAPGNPIWRSIYLEAGPVPDDKTTLPTTTTTPTGHPASCVFPGQQTPPGSTP